MKKIYFLVVLITFTFLNATCLMAQTTYVSGVAEPYGLLLNGNDLYITASDGGGIRKLDVTAATPTSAGLMVALGNPRYMALNGNDLYAASGSSIYKIDIIAATASVLVSGLNGPYGLAINGNNLYISEANTNKISKIDVTATTPTPTDVVTGLNGPFGIVLSGNDLYIAEAYSNKISKIDITAGAPTPVDVVTGLSNPYGITLDGNDLYVTNSSKISLIDITATIPAATDILSGLSGCYGLAVNGNDLYFSEFMGNRVSKFNLTTLSITENVLNTSLNITPNPATDFIQVSGLTSKKQYTMYNVLGVKLNSGTVSKNENIAIKHLSNGLYFIKFDDGYSIKFIKK
jgi:uncharacterized secreted protein with C-terminal beta-propeller domain